MILVALAAAGKSDDEDDLPVCERLRLVHDFPDYEEIERLFICSRCSPEQLPWYRKFK